MSRHRTVLRCSDCGTTAPKWVGRCPTCGAWSSLVEEAPPSGPPGPLGPHGRSISPSAEPVPIGEVDLWVTEYVPTGVSELDRVLGGGLVPGSVSLLGGEPGMGKSTLLLQAAAAMSAQGVRVLYVAAEESARQVRARAERLGALEPELWLAASTSLVEILSHVEAVSPEVLVVDSVQTIQDPAVTSTAGSVSQVRECAASIVRQAKERSLATVMVGHVTKEGGLAGPRVLEHLVDTVLSFEGDRHHDLRLLRACKHRFGSTDRLGLLEMTEEGLRGVDDPSRLFLADRRPGHPGSVVVPVIDGSRPLLVEVQALTASSALALPRRSAEGIDSGRLAVVLAVLERRASVSNARDDVFALAVGGVRVAEPAADLGIALAVASARSGRPLPCDLVALGELGLGGELRQVAQVDRRLSEAARLGFTTAIVPASLKSGPVGIELRRAASLVEALELAGVRAGSPPAPGEGRRIDPAATFAGSLAG